MMKKQSTLFPETEVPVLAELALKDAEKIANQVKTLVCTHCDMIESPAASGSSALKYMTLIL